MRRIDAIVVHHTGSDRSTPASVRRTHMLSFGWADAGYHFLVMPDGSAHDLRPIERAGAHASGANAHSIGLAFAGNLDKHPPTPAAYAAVLYLVKVHQDLFEVPLSRVVGHREAERVGGKPTKKRCPGKFVDMDAFRSALEAVK